VTGTVPGTVAAAGIVPEGAAAVVRGEPLPADRVEALLAIVPPRDGPAGDAEAHRAGRARAARQHRRWATQVVVADELARRACAELGVPVPEPRAAPRVLAVDEAEAARLGSILAAALAFSPAVRALLARLSEGVEVTAESARDYYDRNPDRFLTADALRRGIDPFHGAVAADFVPYERVRGEIEGELREALGRRELYARLDRDRAGVVYAPGYEHPGDPGHPDHEHRH
jgi:hypothetical protein